MKHACTVSCDRFIGEACLYWQLRLSWVKHACTVSCDCFMVKHAYIVSWNCFVGCDQHALLSSETFYGLWSACLYCQWKLFLIGSNEYSLKHWVRLFEEFALCMNGVCAGVFSKQSAVEFNPEFWVVIIIMGLHCRSVWLWTTRTQKQWEGKNAFFSDLCGGYSVSVKKVKRSEKIMKWLNKQMTDELTPQN